MKKETSSLSTARLVQNHAELAASANGVASRSTAWTPVCWVWRSTSRSIKLQKKLLWKPRSSSVLASTWSRNPCQRLALFVTKRTKYIFFHSTSDLVLLSPPGSPIQARSLQNEIPKLGKNGGTISVIPKKALRFICAVFEIVLLLTLIAINKHLLFVGRTRIHLSSPDTINRFV